MDREPGVIQARVPVFDWFDCFTEFCTNSMCEKWHLPEFLRQQSEKGCRFGEKCFNARGQVQKCSCSVEEGWLAWKCTGTHYGHDRSGRPDKKRDHRHAEANPTCEWACKFDTAEYVCCECGVCYVMWCCVVLCFFDGMRQEWDQRG